MSKRLLLWRYKRKKSKVVSIINNILSNTSGECKNFFVKFIVLSLHKEQQKKGSQ